MAEVISINEEVLAYAKKMIPLVIEMQSFVKKEEAWYGAFDNYVGGAKQEIVDYRDAQLKQFAILMEGYVTLSQELYSIVEAFMSSDEEIAKQFVLDIYTTVGEEMFEEVFGE